METAWRQLSVANRSTDGADSLVTSAELDPQPEVELPEPLYAFQGYGVQWLAERGHALLADDMGLGKTVQTIVALRLLVGSAEVGRALVVCPKSVVTSWKRHFYLWAPELVVATIEGPSHDRRRKWLAFARRCQVLIASYETVVRDARTAVEIPFDLVVVDEAQRIKNMGSETSQAVRRLTAQRRWALTGTPLENRIDDVLTIFRFVSPGLFRAGETPLPRSVRQRIAPYVLRRRKQDVLQDLPPKVRDLRYVSLTPAQRVTYERAEREGLVRLAEGQDVTVQHVFELILRLKQICNFDPATGESAKLEWLREYLDEATGQGEKVLVFSQFVGQGIRPLEELLANHDPLVYTGELTVDARDAVVRSFQEDPRHLVLLVSLRAGGTGLNLTAASRVVHFDSWWNPATRLQAEDRAHRIGQTDTVFVSVLVTEGTIEERVEQLLSTKQEMFDRVIDDLSDTTVRRLLSEQDLFGLFGLRPPRSR